MPGLSLGTMAGLGQGDDSPASKAGASKGISGHRRTNSILMWSLRLNRFASAPLWLQPSQCPLQDDEGGVDVPMQPDAAMWANVHSLGKLLLHNPSAVTALLACVSRIDQDKSRADFKSLACDRLREQAPARIGNRPGKPMVLEHVADSQVLHRDQAKSVNDLPRFLVIEVPPLVANLPVNRPNLSCLFSSSLGLLLLPGERPLFPPELLEGFLVEPWILNLLPIGERGEGLQAHVNADCGHCLGFGIGLRIGKFARAEQEGNQVERVGETLFKQPDIITVA